MVFERRNKKAFNSIQLGSSHGTCAPPTLKFAP